jgi:hypothetical protein
MYVRIIRNVDTPYMFSGWLTADLAWRDTHGLPLSYHCGADVTLIVYFCPEFLPINMDAPLFICTKEEQRAVVRFLWSEVVPGAEIHRRMSVRYGNGVVSQRIVYELIERFKNNCTTVNMRKQPDALPRPLLTSTRNESVTWSCRTDV